MEMNSKLYIQRRNSLEIMKKNRLKLTAKDIAFIAMMVAMIEACKIALLAMPNIELISFWIILFTLYFGKLILFVIPVFILVEGLMFGFGLWWIMYLYAWPLLALLVWIFRKMDSVWTWASLSGIFGLSFGLLCAIPYVISGGIYAGFAWWVQGIPWDIVHGIGNFIIMLVLYHPVKMVMNRINNMHIT